MTKKLKTYKFNMPLSLRLAKKKDGKQYMLNLNYLLTKYHKSYNNLKAKYEEILEPFLNGLKIKPPFRITYVFYYGSKRRVDRNNFAVAHDKFFCDALTKFDCIPDDNDRFYVETYTKSGKIDKENPRMEIIVEELDEKDYC